jgi:hypothetical protein
VRLAAAGAGFLLLALPWLIYTWRVSGFLVPQGGRAESAGGLYDFGRLYQTGAVLAALLRNTVPVPIAFLFQSTALRLAVGGALVAALSVSIGLAARRWGRPSRQALGFLAASVGLLAAIYATFFGAGHMAVRWLAPAVVLGVLIAAELVNDARRARRDAIRWLAMAGVLAVIAGRVSSVAIDARRESPTTTWGLLRAVEQVPGQVKIGSFQSGLLSWARPGVTNLDGKVNPAVLAALRERRFGAWLAQNNINLIVNSNLLKLDSDPVLRRAFAIERRPDGVIVLSRAP